MDTAASEAVYRFEGFALDLVRGTLLDANGVEIPLRAKSFGLLRLFVTNAGRLLDRHTINQAIWSDVVVTDDAITQCVRDIRRALGDETQAILKTMPRRGYIFVAEVTTTRGQSLVSSTKDTLALPDKPSLVVLPFQNMSGDPEQEYFADGTVEEIITALSRIRWLFVIARNSSFTYKGQSVDVKQVGRELGVHYVLEGSVRKAGDRVRITVQLIDALTGAHLWSDRFEGSLDAVFEFQDKVAHFVAGAIEPRLEAAEIQRSAKKPPSNLTAYDLYLRALPNTFSLRKASAMQALDLLGQAIEYDPCYGPALALAAWWRMHLELNGWTDDGAENRRKAIELARRALQVTDDDPAALADAAGVLADFGEDIDSALALVEHALELNPSCVIAWHWSAWLRLSAGEPDLAIEHFEKSLRLDPRAQGLRPIYLTGIGIAHFMRQRFAEACPLLLASLQQLPSYLTTYRFLAACHAHMGQLDEAREVLERLRALTSDVLSGATHYRNPEHRELFASGLRLAMDHTPSPSVAA